jgi:hypothetical protein
MRLLQYLTPFVVLLSFKHCDIGTSGLRNISGLVDQPSTRTEKAVEVLVSNVRIHLFTAVLNRFSLNRSVNLIDSSRGACVDGLTGTRTDSIPLSARARPQGCAEDLNMSHPR